jgi:hypothetical protein
VASPTAAWSKSGGGACRRFFVGVDGSMSLRCSNDLPLLTMII